MAINNKTTFKLSSGFEMPAIGFGTYFPNFSILENSAEVEDAVKIALETGYRHLDCAAVYKDETCVGKSIKESGVPRGELFITSKLWSTEHDPKDVAPALDQTLKDLDTDYVDLYLIHWPQAYPKQDPYTTDPVNENGEPIIIDVPLTSTWAAMEELVTSGKARSIGVSNFSKAQLEEILSAAKIAPAVNQIQAHPYLPKTEILEWCKEMNIHITGWAPLSTNRGKGQNAEGDPVILETAEALSKDLFVESDPAIVKAAKSLSITPSQLALSWAIQRGTSVIPKSSHEERIRSNFDIVELPSETMALIDKLHL